MRVLRIIMWAVWLSMLLAVVVIPVVYGRPINDSPPLQLIQSTQDVGTSYVDVSASTFLPSRNSPSEFMSTATILWYGGNYWVDNTTQQQYTVAIEATADYDGQSFYIIYETVGYIGINSFPDELKGHKILSIELWFGVETSNLFPSELIALTPIDYNLHPSLPMQYSRMVDLYFDAGETHNEYGAYNFPPGQWYNIDLGLAAIEDFKRGREQGFFGVGLTAKNWQIDALYGEVGYLHIAGGGRFGFEPFFRIRYDNAVSSVASSFGAIKAMYSDK